MKAFSVILLATLAAIVSGQYPTLMPGQEPLIFQKPGEIVPNLTISFLINAAGGIWQQERVIDSLAYTCTDVLPYIASVVPEIDESSLYWAPICDRVVEGSNNFEDFDATGFCNGIITMVLNLTMSDSNVRVRREAALGTEEPFDIIGILTSITKDLYGIDINAIISDPSMITTICTDVKENFLTPSLPDLISQFGSELLSALLPQSAPLCQDWEGFLQDFGIFNSSHPLYQPIQEAARIASQAAGYDNREALCQAINDALSVEGDGGDARRFFSMELLDSLFDIPRNRDRCSMLGNDLIDDVIEPIINLEPVDRSTDFEITTGHIYNFTGFQGVNPLCNAVQIAFTTIVDLPDPVPAEIIPDTTLNIEFFINAAGGLWIQPRTIDSLSYGCTDILPEIASMVPDFSDYSKYYDPVCVEIGRAADDLDAFDATSSCNNLTDLITVLSSMDDNNRARRQRDFSRGQQDLMDVLTILSNIPNDLYGINPNDTSTICPNVMQFLEPSVPSLVSQFSAELIGRLLPIADYYVCSDWTVFLPSVGIPMSSPYYQVILDGADLGAQLMGFDDRDDFCMNIDQASSDDDRRSLGQGAIENIFDIFTNVDRCAMLGNSAIDDIIEPLVGIDMPGFEVSSYVISRYTGFVGVEEVCRAMETAFTSLSESVVALTITGEALNGEDLVYTPELANRDSMGFRELEMLFCGGVVNFLTDELGSSLRRSECSVLSFSAGSVIAEMEVTLFATSQDVADSLAMDVTDLSTSDSIILSTDGHSLTISSLSVTATDVGEDPVGLPIGAIIGIVVGSIVLVTLIFIIATYLVCRSKNKNMA